ncbi:hypothetical protein N431DRAFT_443645 [Stipitochalara longipes BDJ]|nr:hypothetical protein N431DRAFT_443645 [Stipitochalara longipes BDJ]
MATGLTATHCFDNKPTQSILGTSIYLHIKEIEATMKPDVAAMPAAEFTRVVFARLPNRNPPGVFWAGNMTWFPSIMNILAFALLSGCGLNGSVSGLNDSTKIVRSKEIEIEMKKKVS